MVSKNSDLIINFSTKKKKEQKLYFHNTLSKSPDGHPILHWELKLNSNISAGKYRKNEIQREQLIFHRGAKQKLC